MLNHSLPSQQVWFVKYNRNLAMAMANLSEFNLNALVQGACTTVKEG